MARKAAAFDAILAGYLSEDVDDLDSEWYQGSFYDDIVTSYLGIPTWSNGLAPQPDEDVHFENLIGGYGVGEIFASLTDETGKSIDCCVKVDLSGVIEDLRTAD